MELPCCTASFHGKKQLDTTWLNAMAARIPKVLLLLVLLLVVLWLLLDDMRLPLGLTAAT